MVNQLNDALKDRYRVERELGQGGMATVYLARDLKHDRRVAIKVLHPDLAAALGGDRFLAEVRTTARLQHPHILPLLDSGSAAGMLYYVMPFVDGESLRGRLDREKQLPLEDTLRIAREVADALGHAHAQGIIHRDIKPENILLQGGHALVADFGIALAVSAAGGARMTQTGLSLGTPQYMSPEQAMGERTLDQRSDIYALGAVTYEMLTGEPPFTGATVQAIVAKVLSTEPTRPTDVRKTIPPHIEATVLRALAKLPADRWATAAAFSAGLGGDMSRAPYPGTAPIVGRDVPESRSASRALLWSGWAVAALFAVAAFVMRQRDEAESPPVTARFIVTLPDSIQLAVRAGTAIALSSDGKTLVFAGRVGSTNALFVRHLDDPTPQLIRGTEGADGPGARIPALSPSGDWVAFTIGRGIVKVPLAGGERRIITNEAVGGFSWGDADEIVFRDARYSLWRVSADGGPATLLAAPDSARSHVRYSTPQILPGGKHVLITIFKGAANVPGTQLRPEIGVVSIPDGKVTELGATGSYPRYLPGGIVVFGRDDALYAAPLSRDASRLTADPVPVLESVALFAATQVAAFTVSQNGTLAYIGGGASNRRSLMIVDRTGKSRPLALARNDLWHPRLSGDGKRLAFSIRDRNGGDVWSMSLSSLAPQRLSFDGGSGRPEWMPGDSRIAYISTDSTGSSVRVQAWDGSTPASLLVRPEGGVAQISFGPAGTVAALRVIRAVGGTGDRDIWVAPIDSLGAARPFVASPTLESDPRVSPNGRLLAYTTEEGGTSEVYVRPLGGSGGRVRVSASGGDELVWSRDGRELFYRSGRTMYSAQIVEQPELAVVRRDSLFEDTFVRQTDHPNYDVFPSGREFVMLGEERAEATLSVVVNWLTEVRTRLGTRVTPR